MPRYIEDTILKSITIKGLKLLDWVNFVDTIPSADVRPVIKGKWIHQTKFGRIECTACGHVFRSYVYPRNFCPNCGADMRGDTE